ncbi:hypothetical protein GCM10011365_05690 [Marinicella pacifica]|uniref:Lipoprotein n=1 Tax=Marinicella pacifica TaxID=1171543 RepID=A0A917CFJ7_9GAMM|nr:lipoprotein [Marinicella pacifica]GGF87511.1 hypothetical protein GCM10011365_05690 [Marinicella pacifica]
MKFKLKYTRLIASIHFGFLLLLVASLTACGNKGDLYQPQDVAVDKIHQDPESENNAQSQLPF